MTSGPDAFIASGPLCVRESLRIQALKKKVGYRGTEV
jgi:hypothetical protein